MKKNCWVGVLESRSWKKIRDCPTEIITVEIMGEVSVAGNRI